MPDESDLDRAAAALLTTSRALIGVSLRSIAAAPVEVTLPQHRLLVRLASRGPQTVSALGGELGMGQPATTRLVDRLERAGLVERSRSTTDARAVEVVLLPAAARSSTPSPPPVAPSWPASSTSSAPPSAGRWPGG